MFKPVRLSDAIHVVSLYDPAIDWGKMCNEGENIEAARLRIVEAAHKSPASTCEGLKAKNGEQLSRFLIGVIPPDEMIRLEDECRQSGARLFAWRCFLSGVRGIENWPTAPKKQKLGDVERVDPAWLKEEFGGRLREIAIEIGFHVFNFNRLTEEEISL